MRSLLRSWPARSLRALYVCFFGRNFTRFLLVLAPATGPRVARAGGLPLPLMRAWFEQSHGRHHKAPPQPCALTTYPLCAFFSFRSATTFFAAFFTRFFFAFFIHRLNTSFPYFFIRAGEYGPSNTRFLPVVADRLERGLNRALRMDRSTPLFFAGRFRTFNFTAA